MKKTSLLIVVASLLFACGQTKNEQDLIDFFIGTGTDSDNIHFRPDVYNQMHPAQNIYLQEFNNVASSDWSNKNDENTQQAHENGELIIRGKKNYYTWKNVPSINTLLDFQMEIRAQFNFATVTSVDAAMGIVYGVDNAKNTYHYIHLFNNTNHMMRIGYYDGKNYADAYNQQSNIAKNAHHIYTIRKAGSKMYFFVNKKLVYGTSYKSFPPNYGFLLTSNGIVSVDYVRIDYIATETP